MDMLKTSKVDSDANDWNSGRTMLNKKNTIDKWEQLQKEIIRELKDLVDFFNSSDTSLMIRDTEDLLLKTQNLGPILKFLNQNLEVRDLRICIFIRAPGWFSYLCQFENTDGVQAYILNIRN